jgi:hypothetical protein
VLSFSVILILCPYLGYVASNGRKAVNRERSGRKKQWHNVSVNPEFSWGNSIRITVVPGKVSKLHRVCARPTRSVTEFTLKSKQGPYSQYET